MKIQFKLLSFCLIILMLFTACGKQHKDLGDKYVKGMDSQYMFRGDMDGQTFAATDDGYYILMGSYLFFADKKTMKTTPLCNKPDCKHIDEEDNSKVYNCNAYVGSNTSISFIEYYNGKIYTMSYFDAVEKKPESTLIEISPDGSKRKKIAQIKNPEFMLMHRGYVYHVERFGDMLGIAKTSISKPKKEPEQVFKADFSGAMFQIHYAYGDHFYFTLYGSDQKKEKYIEQIFEYNIKTKKVNQIIKGDSKSLEKLLFPVLKGIYNGKLLYLTNAEAVDVNKDSNEYFQCDLDGKNERLYHDFGDSDRYTHLFVDEKYNYQLEYRYGLEKEEFEERSKKFEFNVYDKDFNKIIGKSNFGLPRSYYRVVGDDKHMFIKYIDSDAAQTMRILYLDKSQIANGNLEFKELISAPYSNSYPGYSLQ